MITFGPYAPLLPEHSQLQAFVEAWRRRREEEAMRALLATPAKGPPVTLADMQDWGWFQAEAG